MKRTLSGLIVIMLLGACQSLTPYEGLSLKRAPIDGPAWFCGAVCNDRSE